MLIGPSWYSGAIFEGSGSAFDSPKGTWAAYPALSSSVGARAWTGDVGGGLWIMSSHAANPTLAASAMTWLGTSTPSQDLSQGYPGYVPAAKSWIAEQDASGFFASPLAPAFATAASEVWTGFAQRPLEHERSLVGQCLTRPHRRVKLLVTDPCVRGTDLGLRLKSTVSKSSQ